MTLRLLKHLRGALDASEYGAMSLEHSDALRLGMLRPAVCTALLGSGVSIDLSDDALVQLTKVKQWLNFVVHRHSPLSLGGTANDASPARDSWRCRGRGGY
jgi:hypothetical protein